MAHRNSNLLTVGGNSPCLIATVKKHGEPVTPQKNYELEMYIARHGNTIDDSPKNGYIANFYYDRSLRKLRTVIPKKQSIEMAGHFVYHLGVKTPSSKEFRPEFGVFNFIQGLQN